MWIIIQSLFFQSSLFLLLSFSWLKDLDNNNNNNNNTLIDKKNNNRELTKYEINKIEKFRELIGNASVPGLDEYLKSNDFLVRWLRDSDMDINLANRMLQKAIIWRKDNHIDTILNKTFLPPKYKLCDVIGFDKEEGPIMITRQHRVDLRKLIANGQMQNMIQHTNQCSEKIMKASLQGNGMISKEIKMTSGINIVDCMGFTMKQHGCFQCVELYRRILKITNQFYPQSTSFIVVINVPKIALPIVNILRGVMSPYFRDKFKVFGTDKQEWKSFLLSIVSKEELLEDFGGTNKKKWL